MKAGGRFKGESSRAFWILLAAITLGKVFLAGRLDPCDDECYYFSWALFPRLSYLDHPPLTSWMIALSRLVLGENIWAIRIWPLAAGVAFACLGRALVVRLAGRPAGDRAGMFLTLMPLFAGNGLIFTPDTLLVLCWAGALLWGWKAVTAEPFDPKKWIVVGALVGVGLLSKYTMILFFASLGLLWLRAPGKRREIFGGALISAAVATCWFLPVILWNARNDWISFRFQLDHGFSGTNETILATAGGYFGGLLLAASPFLAILAALSCGRSFFSRSLDRQYLASFFWATILFFLASALRTKVEPNWAMIAFVSGLQLAAWDWPEYGRFLRAATSGGLAVFLLIGAFGLTYLALPENLGLRFGGKPLRFPKMEEFAGGRRLSEAVKEKREEIGADFVCPGRHQLFAKLSFFAPELRDAMILPGEGLFRFPWLDDSTWRGKEALVVVASRGIEQILAPFFDRLENVGERTIAWNGATMRRLYFFRGSNYRPADQLVGTRNEWHLPAERIK